MGDSNSRTAGWGDKPMRVWQHYRQRRRDPASSPAAPSNTLVQAQARSAPAAHPPDTGQVETNVVKLSPFASSKVTREVEGRKARAVT